MARKNRSDKENTLSLVDLALHSGFPGLSEKDRLRILENPDALSSVHDGIWREDPKTLHESWSCAVASFA